MTSGRLLKYLARYSVGMDRRGDSTLLEFHAMQSTLWSQPQKRKAGKEQTSTRRVVRVPRYNRNRYKSDDRSTENRNKVLSTTELHICTLLRS